MRYDLNRRKFIKRAAEGSLGFAALGNLSSHFYSDFSYESGWSDHFGASINGGDNYEWMKNARILLVDGYRTPPFIPKLTFDAEKLAETMVDMHANVLRIATSGNTGWYIPGTQFAVASDLGNRDILAESIAACKPRGIKVLPYLRCGGPVIPEVMKFEWAQKMTPEGDVGSWPVYGVVNYPLCWNTPYRQAFYELVETIVSKYDVCGFYFDSWLLFYFFRGILSNRENLCYCDGCTGGFREATGKELPYKQNVNDYTPDELETIVRYHFWYKDEMFKVFTETKRIIKSHNDIPLIYNVNNPTRILDKFQNDMRIMAGSDAVLYERGRDILDRAEGISLVAAHGIPVWPYVGTTEEANMKNEVYTAVAFGGSPILTPGYVFVNQPEIRGPIKEAFRLYDENDKYISDFKSDTFCAVVWNDIKGFYENFSYIQAQDRHLLDKNARQCSLGSFKACIDKHIQATSLLKSDLDKPELLSKYKVLYLADTCHLTNDQVRNITNYVGNGGGLVMTWETSLYDAGGEKLDDFALGRLAGIRHLKNDTQKEGNKFYLKFRSEKSAVRLLTGDEPVQLTELFEKIEILPGATVIADIISGTGNAPVAPGLVVSRYGKGRIVYVPAALGAIYMLTGNKVVSDLIGNIIKYVCPSGLPYEINSHHDTLLSNMTIKGETRVFHLINRSGNTLPLNDVVINFRIPSGKKIKNITSFIPVKFTQKQEKNILKITIPQIEKYQAIVVEVV